jgi:D-proline reductase (dithiol) PrdB
MPVTHRTFVSYIDRTREFYRAQGYADAYAWARHTDAPFTPLPKPLAECRLGLVTTASPWREQKVVDGVLRGRKQVYSAPVGPPPERLFTDDLAWDRNATHTDDVPSFLPIPQLQAWVAEGRLGSLAARFHGVPTDYSQRRTQEQDAPEVLARLRADAADVALLVPL